MITLITGQPGAGKTLFTLQFVRELAEKEKRTVHYSGIKDLRLPWLELAFAVERRFSALAIGLQLAVAPLPHEAITTDRLRSQPLSNARLGIVCTVPIGTRGAD